MKKVMLIDDQTLLREYLKQKLTDDQIEVILPQESRGSFTKLISSLPNLVILNLEADDYEALDFLEKKSADFNASDIPVIITGPKQDRTNIAALAKYGVIKYFEKPIQFDIFFEAIGKILKTNITMDDTPCVLDLHRNGNIIFIELALGLNREKLSLLQYRLTEIIENQEIDSPKIIIMLTNLDLSFVDGYNLEFLIENVINCPKVKNKNVKILSFSSFVPVLLEGHEAYEGIECSDNLPRVLSTLLDTSLSSDVSELITEKILTSSESDDQNENAVIDTRFSSDSSTTRGKYRNDGTVLNIAIIDSNIDSLEQTKNAFTQTGATCLCFTSGQNFMDAYIDDMFSLVILDVLVDDQTGMQVLQFLQRKETKPVVIVYSQSFQKNIIVKALSFGARNYIVKPQKPNVLVQKTFAVLKGDFS